MIQLLDGCYCSELSVTPKNWNQAGATLECRWQISYRFYEPGQKPYQVIIKGANALKTLAERRKRTKELLEDELLNLKTYGYNPRTKTYTISPVPADDEQLDVSPQTPFWEALEFARDHLDVSDKYMENIRTHMTTFKKAAENLKLSHLPVSIIGKKEVRKLMDQGAEVRGDKWTPNNFNAHRSSLMALFEVLDGYDAITINPVKATKKKTVVKKIREQLTNEQRAEIRKSLVEKFPNFKRFIEIFFHSGARISELLRLKIKDVDLKQQRYKLAILKGKSPKETYKIIKNIALPLWVEQVQGGNPDDYVFSLALNNGPHQMRPEYITRRWKRHIKNNEELNISADLYSLKYSNSEEIAFRLSMEAAAEMNSHEGTAMVKSIYAANESARLDKSQKERIKRIGNDF